MKKPSAKGARDRVKRKKEIKAEEAGEAIATLGPKSPSSASPSSPHSTQTPASERKAEPRNSINFPDRAIRELEIWQTIHIRSMKQFASLLRRRADLEQEQEKTLERRRSWAQERELDEIALMESLDNLSVDEAAEAGAVGAPMKEMETVKTVVFEDAADRSWSGSTEKISQDEHLNKVGDTGQKWWRQKMAKEVRSWEDEVARYRRAHDSTKAETSCGERGQDQDGQAEKLGKEARETSLTTTKACIVDAGEEVSKLTSRKEENGVQEGAVVAQRARDHRSRRGTEDVSLMAIRQEGRRPRPCYAGIFGLDYGETRTGFVSRREYLWVNWGM